MSVNGNEEPAGEIRHQYSSVVTAIIPVYRASSVRMNACNNSCLVLQEKSAVYVEQ